MRFGVAALAAAGVLHCAAAFAEPVSWNGTWSGTSNSGNATTVVISGGKVTKWLNNGFPKNVVSSTVSANQVTITDDGTWKATMTSKDGKTATMSASGKGASGGFAKNSSTLTKR
ncbi:hypothetical protein [Bosea sp. 117]|uniref:hypothetical protein n=1 Tax=Bosea sp. 117 TaxID=1125973 RepID=UPI0012DF70D6|nr:hypothetical protein [Bosea sp. 117]